MYSEQEEKLKAHHAANQAQTIGGGIMGNAAREVDTLGCEASRDKETGGHSLRRRIQVQVRTAKRESRRLEKLMELEYLLEKNPEIARILDLIEEVR